MKTCLLKENYRPIVTTEIRHGFLLIWMGDVGQEVLSGAAGQPDFHFEGEEAKNILRYFDRKSTDLMKAGYPVVSMAIPDEHIRIVERKIMKKSQLKTLIKEIVKNLQLEYGGPLNKEIYRKMTPAQQEVVNFLLQKSFTFARVDTSTGQLIVMLERPWGKGRHGGNRFAAVRPDGTINDGLSVRDFIKAVGENVNEMIANKDATPEPMGFVNVEESDGNDKDLEEAKKLAAKIWGDKVSWVAFYPASSNTKYFRVDINGTAEWLTKTQTSGWLYSKNNKMVSVNDLSVNETLGNKITFFSDIPIGTQFMWGSGKDKRLSGIWLKKDERSALDTNTGKVYPFDAVNLRATQVYTDFEKGHQEFKDKYTERTNPDGTYIDDMESGMKSQAYSGLKENEFDGYKAPKHNATVTSAEMKEAQDIASKIFGGVYITRFHSKGLKGWPIYFEVSLHGPNGEKRWICKGKDGKWLMSSGKGESSRWVSADKHIVKEGGRWSMGEYTPEQEQSIYLLRRQGFREVSSFPNEPDADGGGTDNRVTVVLQKKQGPVNVSVEVDADGMCNGQPIQDYLKAGLEEQTSSGAAGGQAGGMISVPAWGTKNKEGSPRAIAATKRMKGWKVAKSISEKVK